MTWLSKLGLMRVSEHEGLIKNSVSFHLRNYSSLERHRDDLKAEIADLRPDALLWRAARDRRANNRKGKKS